MSIVKKLPIIGDFIEVIDEVIDHITPDKTERERLKANARSESHQEKMADIAGRWAAAVEQAKHPSLFVSGARPYGLWIINTALAATVIIALYKEATGQQASDFLLYLIQSEFTAFGVIYGIRGLECWSGTARKK